MSFGKKGLFAALEEGDLDGGVATVAPAEVDVAAADAMTDVVESDSAVNEEGVAIESLALAIEEAIDDAEQAEQVVEQVADVAEMPVEETAETADQGEGLGEGEAVLAEEAFRLVFRKLGGSVTKSRIVPGMESFKSSNSRRTATRVALENAMDTIKAVWERILQAIKSLWSKIKAFIKKIFDANLNLEKGAKALKEKVKGVKGKSTKDNASDFVDEGLAELFPTKGAVNPQVVKEYLSNHQDYASGFDNAPGYIDKAIGVVQAPNTKVVTDGLFDVAVGMVNILAPGVSTDLKSFVGEKEIPGVKKLINGKIVEVKLSITADKDDDGEDVKEIDLSYSFITDESNEVSDKKKVVIAGATELDNLLNEVVSFSKINGKLADTLKKADEKVTKLIAAAEKVVANTSEDKIAAARKRMASQKTVTKLASSTAGSFGAAIASMNIRAGKGALRYVSACVSKYA